MSHHSDGMTVALISLTSAVLDCGGHARGIEGHSEAINTNNFELTDTHGKDYKFACSTLALL